MPSPPVQIERLPRFSAEPVNGIERVFGPRGRCARLLCTILGLLGIEALGAENPIDIAATRAAPWLNGHLAGGKKPLHRAGEMVAAAACKGCKSLCARRAAAGLIRFEQDGEQREARRAAGAGTEGNLGWLARVVHLLAD